MRVAVTIPVYNEKTHLPELIQALIDQTLRPFEVFFVDDGSTDGSAELIRAYQKEHPFIHLLVQPNRGPAAARNLAWRHIDAELCVFTDGDCVPDREWLEKLTVPFTRKDVGATAGTYRTLNPSSILARFIGLEVDWRYRNVRGEINVHGSYNLAVRKKILQDIGGFREDYKRPSGEDWDLTYKISRSNKIIFVPEARVGHYHPEHFWSYMKNQFWRAYDRMKVYRDHPSRAQRDTYTGAAVKYQVAAAALFTPALIADFLFFHHGWISAMLLTVLLWTALIPFGYFFRKDPAVAWASLPIQLFRHFAWALGALKGALDYWILRRHG